MKLERFELSDQEYIDSLNLERLYSIINKRKLSCLQCYQPVAYVNMKTVAFLCTHHGKNEKHCKKIGEQRFTCEDIDRIQKRYPLKQKHGYEGKTVLAKQNISSQELSEGKTKEVQNRNYPFLYSSALEDNAKMNESSRGNKGSVPLTTRDPLRRSARYKGSIGARDHGCCSASFCSPSSSSSSQTLPETSRHVSKSSADTLDYWHTKDRPSTIPSSCGAEQKLQVSTHVISKNCGLQKTSHNGGLFGFSTRGNPVHNEVTLDTQHFWASQTAVKPLHSKKRKPICPASERRVEDLAGAVLSQPPPAYLVNQPTQVDDDLTGSSRPLPLSCARHQATPSLTSGSSQFINNPFSFTEKSNAAVNPLGQGHLFASTPLYPKEKNPFSHLVASAGSEALASSDYAYRSLILSKRPINSKRQPNCQHPICLPEEYTDSHHLSSITLPITSAGSLYPPSGAVLDHDATPNSTPCRLKEWWES